ncbi:serine/threonine-protein kinase [Polyangium aurulentum]|uniref:serine/threonine-protein kinase n=1 Tax=Polyangium aurulentum TaxID=2567896 RepID=UPI0010AEA3AC|nr:serine/threonine-protein kinase [Polyangium aurulentum]UQA55759.1 serine/threonine-protein kinase PknK [Polyangium aurulentum]
MVAGTPKEHAPGELLDGRFLLVERLGRGGFGDVWRAEELLPDGTSLRPIALKLLHKTAYDVASWTEEAKLLASFRHPSLVTVYAAGLLGGPEPLPFVAMELLEGSTLGDLARERRRVPWRRVLGWARATAAALDVIHARGIVHLDLKPANLFVTTDGTLKVLDFGISRRAGSKAPAVRAIVTSASDAGLETALFVAAQNGIVAQTTRAGGGSSNAVVGTPGYMAPEILELAEPTPAADAYALAVCVVKLATGRLPYEDVADEPAALSEPSAMSAWWSDVRDATLRGRVRDLAADPARLPRGLVALLHRLLSVDPLQRGLAPGGLAALFDEVWARPHGVLDPPYPGLAPLPAEGEGMLFGREDDVARLGRELAFEPSLVLHGPRGAGKSSLARAGLAAYLARGAVDAKDDWILVHVRPGDAPDRALDEALAGVDEALAGAGFDGLASFAAASRVGVVLLVDPLDEAVEAPAEASGKLFALLAAIAEGGVEPGLRALGVVSESHLPRLVESGAPGGALRASLRFVGSPSAAAMHDIATGPARLAGVRVIGAEAVVAELQREVRGKDDRMPLVALALRAFWESRASEGGAMVLHVDRWRSLGGVVGALAAHAERVLAGLDDEARDEAIEILLALSTTDRKAVRRDEAELADALGGGALYARALGSLERAGLLRRREGRVELSHPSLAALPRLDKVRAREAERLVFLESLREAAGTWERADRPPELLLSGALLDEAVRRDAPRMRGVGRIERELIAASRRRARRGLLARGALVAGAAALIGLGIAGKSALDAQRARTERARAEAEERAYLAEVVGRSRRADDPYQRAAWIAEAVDKGATDPALPLDLLRVASDLPHAHFLALEPATSPEFPWSDRWLVAGGPGTSLLLVDFKPFDPGTPEDGADAAEPAPTHMPDPRASALRPHEGPLVERVPLPFDSALATRSGAGEVRVFRLRPDGTAALAAIAPARCTGALRAADAAPVLACAGEAGIVRWDLRRAGEVDTYPFQGIVLDVSPDGARVVAAAGAKVLVWTPGEKRAEELTRDRSLVLARFSPRDSLLALVEQGGFEIVDPARPAAPVFRGASAGAPSFVRWDEGGLDLAICGAEIGHEDHVTGSFHYLRSGARAASDPLPKGAPCDPPPSAKRPARLASLDEVRDLARLALGPRAFVGGYRLADGRVLTRDLVLFSGATAASRPLVRFAGHDPEASAMQPETRSVVAVARVGEDAVAFGVSDEVRIYRIADGKRELARKGHLLGRCADGRVAAWEREGEAWRVLDARSGATLGSAPREPGLVLGVDSACRTLFTQRLDGTLVATSLDAGAKPRPLAAADGYVYDVRPSPARGGVGAGLLIAVGSGALARIDEATGEVRLLGYASPRATAIGDGPRPGELVYADDTGVVLLRPDGGRVRLLEAMGGTTWEDVSVAPDGLSLLLASADRVAALDVSRGEIMGTLPLPARTRFAPWDGEGSVFVWSFDRAGGPEGEVIPRGRPLSQRIARSLSNLRVERGRLSILR